VPQKMSKISNLPHQMTDVFFQALNAPKLVFGRSTGPRWESLRRFPRLSSRQGGGQPLSIPYPIPSPSTTLASLSRLSAPSPQHKFPAALIRTRDARLKGPHTSAAFIITRRCNSCRSSYGIVGCCSRRSYVASQSIRANSIVEGRKERVQNKVINDCQRASCSS